MPPVELHIDTQAQQDVVVAPSAFPPDALPGDLIAIRPVLPSRSKGKGKDKPLLFKVDKAADPQEQENEGKGGVVGLARRRGKSQVTVSPMVAQSFGWVKNRIEVELSLVPAPIPRKLTASHVELYFNNMYLSRPDSFQLSLALTGKVLHVGQRVVLPGSGARLRVGDMYSAVTARTSSSASSARHDASSSSSSAAGKGFEMNTPLDSAYITDSTKIVFRSESARHYIFVEVSAELWQFEEDGSMLLEKAELFLHELFAHYSGKMTRDAEDTRSKGVATSHVTTIILYGRVIYDDAEDAEEARAPLQRLENGTLYRDFYKVILDLSPSPPQSIIHTVALELRRWQSTVLLRTLADGTTEKLSGRLANAHESPVLEATNLALNSFEEHWIDRDLQRTGLEIIVMTAGSSFYQVEKSLLRLTTERMLFHGIGLDLISLSKMPLHTVPLFQFRSPDPQAAELSLAVAESTKPAAEAPSTSLAAAFSPQQHPPPQPYHPAPGTSFPNSHRSPANFGPHRFPHGPSSLRDRPSPAAAAPAPPLRDPHALDPAQEKRNALIPPIAVPDDQRDPLYFDPPPPAPVRQVNHARGPSVSGGGFGSHSRQASAHAGLTPSFSASPAFPSSSAPSNGLSSLPPLPPPLGSTSTPSAPSNPQLETSLYYAEPLFVFPHFFGTQIDKPHRVDRFMPRARCYELFVQGVGGERAPIAIPLLPPLASAAEENSGAGFLTELERRMQRREAYDAAAVGARDPAEMDAEGGATRVWEVRESGALTGSASEGSSGVGRELGVSVSTEEGETPSESEGSLVSRRRTAGGGDTSTTEESEADAEEEEDETPELGASNALGLGLPPSSAAAASRRTGSLRSSSRHPSRSRARAGSTSTSSTSLAATSSTRTAGGSSADDADLDSHERGRRGKKQLGEQQHSLSTAARSKTPVPSSTARRARSRAGSVAASVRTVSSVQTGRGGAEGGGGVGSGSSSLALRKASTPALIARLTGAPATGVSSGGGGGSSASSLLGGTGSSAASTTASSSTTASAARPSWLSLFGRAASSVSTTSATSASSKPPPSSSALSPSASASPLPPVTTSAAPSLVPQVAVARVDVQANLKPDWASASSVTGESDGTGTTGTEGTGVVLGFSSASQRPSSRSRTRAEAARAAVGGGGMGRTMPISIGAKAGEGGSGEKGAGGAGGAGAGGGKENDGRGGAKGSVSAGGGGGGGGGKGMSSSSLKAYELTGSSGVRKAFGLGRSAGGGKISVAERFNPSKPGKRSVGLADQARRWAGILIAERRSLKLGVKWRSLTRGACLPITTDYLPSADTLQHQYSEYRYTVPTSAVASSPFLRIDHPKRSHTLTLVTELICQRLSQGFQICTPANAVGALDAINVATSKTLPDVLRDIGDGEVTAVYLSLSNQIHRIWYDRRTAAVVVKILRRRRTWAKVEYGYRPLIWTRAQDNYDAISRLMFPYPDLIDASDWQHADRLVAGAERAETHLMSTRYRRTRLLLIPAAKVPDREYIVSTTKALQGMDSPSDGTIQAQGFYALMELIENARWAPSGVEKEPLPITQTNLDAPGWAESVAQAQAEAASNSVNASPSVAPVQQPRQTWLSRMQGRTAKTGEEAPPTPNVERDLELPPAVTSTPGKEVVAALKRSDTSNSLATISASLTGSGSGSTPSPRRPVVQMTHAVVLDLDPTKKSDRAERVLCHLDRSHNVQAAYHLELAWLTASGKIVDNAIQSWTRQMARYGLNLVEVSTRPVLARHNPFQKPSVIRLAVQPPSAKIEIDDEDDLTQELETPSQTEHYLSRLLRTLDYFLDLGADSTFPSTIDVQYSYRRTPTPHSQFIHRTGSVLVSIFEDDEGPGFAYAPNRIYTSHHPEVNPVEVVRRLLEVCVDEEHLSSFWAGVGGR
ncbi:hypothetical protein JCM6882_004107 [Rhodosporidiobolus microsporus]